MAEGTLEEVAFRAATLDELLSIGGDQAALDGPTPLQVEAALAAWCDASVAGDTALFEERLRRDGLTRAEVVRRLSGVDQSSFSEARSELWGCIFHAVRRGASPEFNPGEARGGDAVPFEDLILGVCEEAATRLHRTIDVRSVASDQAVIRLVSELCHELSLLCSPSFYLIMRSRPLESAQGSPDAYEAFVEWMRNGGALEFFLAQPVLLRLMVVVVNRWIETTTEFLARLKADQHDLAALTTTSGPFILDDTTIVGDRHNHGRAVRSVTFTNGSIAFYKPKDLKIDAAWSELIRDLNVLRPPFCLRVPRVLVKEGYGWTECITHDGCATPEMFADYFQRAGGWLCLFHLFSGMDMHEQNIIASGAHPVPVDLETLLQPAQTPQASRDDPRRAYTLAGDFVARSVLSTGMLPGYGRHEGRAGAVPHGGLLNVASQQRRIHWTEINTGRMRPHTRWEAGPPNQNRPHAGGVYSDIKNHIDDVAGGYERYAAFILTLVHGGGVDQFLNRFGSVRVRKLIKNTRFYSLLLDRLLDPTRMKSGAIWSAQLDFVCRFVDWSAKDDGWWPLLAAERTALAELDVPYFMMKSDDRTIFDVDDRKAESDVETGLERSRQNLENLDADGIKCQADIIRLSLASVRPVADLLGVRQSRRRRALRHNASGDRRVFGDRANAIADHLRTVAITDTNSAAWLSLDWLQDSTVCQLAPLGADLYNGATGVAVFLAAHARVSSDPASATLALGALAALRGDLLSANAGRTVRAMGVGGATGLGSVIYGFTVIAQLLRDRALAEDAVKIASLCSQEAIEASPSIDLMDGTAGALLGLSKLYGLTGASEVLEPIEWCGRQLLQSSPDEGAKVMAAGLSHGPAGVALALATLATHFPRLGGRSAEDAAFSWVRHENKVFCEARQAWPDARAQTLDEDSFWPCQWCHGAAGIGLARVAMAERLRYTPKHQRSVALSKDVARAVSFTMKSWPYASDSLCCGSLSGIELLAEAGRISGQPDLSDVATQRMLEVTLEADSEGDFLWEIGTRAVNVGLYRGVAGVGYTLLRQVDATLPNILVWD